MAILSSTSRDGWRQAIEIVVEKAAPKPKAVKHEAVRNSGAAHAIREAAGEGAEPAGTRN